jgi:hypothetical protein
MAADDPRGAAPRKLVTHDVPVNADLIVPITLPMDLTRTEAERIGRILLGLAFDDEEEVR